MMLKSYLHTVYLLLQTCSLTSAIVVPSRLQEWSTSVTGSTHLFVGADLILTCTLHDEMVQTYTAHNISFSFLDPYKINKTLKCLPMTSVHVLNKTSAMLIVHNVTVEEAGEYSCHVGSTSCQIGHDSDNLTLVGFSDDVIIEYPPQNVTNFKCVHNWYESMTCTWQHPVNYVYKSKMKVTSGYTDLQGKAYKCPDLRWTGCNWNRGNFIPAGILVIDVKVENIDMNRTTSKIFVVNNTSEIVKPAPVEELTSAADLKMPGCVHLSWKHSKKHWDKVFRIKHQTAEDMSFIVVADNVTKTSFTACGYKPYTRHTFSVECYPTSEFSGFWSDPVYIDGLTPMAAPDLGPQTINGSFTTTRCVAGRRNVTVMWKEVTKSAQNGLIDSYIIKLGERHVKVDANKHSADFQLPCFSTTELKLFAQNDGGNSLKPSILIIPSVNVSVSQKIKDSFAVEVTSHPISRSYPDSLRAVWEADEGAKYLNYTIFWCEGHPKQTCQSEVSWTEVPGLRTFVEVPLSATVSERYLFGISVTDTRSGMASGIFWTECLFTCNPSSLPSTKDMKVESGVESVWVTWNLLRCTYQSKTKVTGYMVKWCRESHCRDNQEISSATVPATQFSYTVSALTASVSYAFTVQPLSHDIKGGEIKPWKTAVPSAPGPQTWHWIVTGLVGILIVIAVFYLLRKFIARGEEIKTLKDNKVKHSLGHNAIPQCLSAASNQMAQGTSTESLLSTDNVHTAGTSQAVQGHATSCSEEIFASLDGCVSSSDGSFANGIFNSSELHLISLPLHPKSQKNVLKHSTVSACISDDRSTAIHTPECKQNIQDDKVQDELFLGRSDPKESMHTIFSSRLPSNDYSRITENQDSHKQQFQSLSSAESLPPDAECLIPYVHFATIPSDDLYNAQIDKENICVHAHPSQFAETSRIAVQPADHASFLRKLNKEGSKAEKMGTKEHVHVLLVDIKKHHRPEDAYVSDRHDGVHTVMPTTSSVLCHDDVHTETPASSPMSKCFTVGVEAGLETPGEISGIHKASSGQSVAAYCVSGSPHNIDYVAHSHEAVCPRTGIYFNQNRTCHPQNRTTGDTISQNKKYTHFKEFTELKQETDSSHQSSSYPDTSEI